MKIDEQITCLPDDHREFALAMKIIDDHEKVWNAKAV